MRIEKNIGRLRALPELKGWVQLEQVRKARRLELFFSVHEENRGRKKIGGWNIFCSGVREAHIEDFNGGGLALYSITHPAARQYAARRAELRWVAIDKKAAALGALIQAHAHAVDDWIPFDRYVSLKTISGKQCVCRGPDFLMQAYARALQAEGKHPHIVLRRNGGSKRGKLRVLHFGNSFVVAAVFGISSKAVT